MDANLARSRDSSFRKKLARSRQGSRDAFGQLLEGLREYLLAVAQGELDPEVRARVGPSDAVQDTFAQAAQAFDDFRGTTEVELRAWLRVIVVNRCRGLRDTHLLAAKRDARREVAIPETDSKPILINVAAKGLPPSKHAAAAEDAARLIDALSLLTEEYRQVVWLRNWEGLSFEEIGAQIGRSGDAARKLFSRAIEKLGKVLEATDGENSRPER